MISKICPQCEKGFSAHHAADKHCSQWCAVRGRSGGTRRQDHTPNVRCLVCGKAGWRKASSVKKSTHFFCSERCRGKHHSRKYRGADNPNFTDAGRRTCEGCGKEYRSYNKTRRFCGIKCGQSIAASTTLTSLCRGREAEEWCFANLIASGYCCQLSAASRGPFDVIAWNGEETLLIQVKRTGNYHRRMFPRWIKTLEELKTSQTVKKQIRSYVDGHGWFIKTLEATA